MLYRVFRKQFPWNYSFENENSFEDCFLTKALANREARRVFKAWKRKDDELLKKLYKEIKA